MTLMMSHYLLMFFWSSVCVRAEDLPSLNVSSAEKTEHNTTSPPCFIQIGDAPYTKCDTGEDLGRDDVSNSSTERGSQPWTTSTVSVSTTENLTTTTDVHPTSITTTNTPTPASIAPTAHSLKDTKHTANTPAELPTTHTLPMKEEDRLNTTASTNCTFDPCTDLHVTCFNTPDQQCGCPGVTPPADPAPPLSVEVTAVSSRAVLVQWCADHSPGLRYLVLFYHEGLEQKTLSLGPAARQVFVSELKAEHTYRVCVKAVRREKTSGPRCTSVLMGIDTEPYMFILTATCAVLMLTVAALSFCLFKHCKKPPVETPHLTKLISISNPAFFNP